MKRWIKIVLSVVVALLLVAQLIPVDRSVPALDESQDFLVAENVPTEMATLIKGACYDCHSYQTQYPWYAKVAPLSFWIQDHINHGREELNFSDWNALSKRKKIKALNDMSEEVEEKKMPLDIYTLVHKDAKLSDDEIILLLNWSKSLSNELLGAN